MRIAMSLFTVLALLVDDGLQEEEGPAGTTMPDAGSAMTGSDMARHGGGRGLGHGWRARGSDTMAGSGSGAAASRR